MEVTLKLNFHVAAEFSRKLIPPQRQREYELYWDCNKEGALLPVPGEFPETSASTGLTVHEDDDAGGRSESKTESVNAATPQPDVDTQRRRLLEPSTGNDTLRLMVGATLSYVDNLQEVLRNSSSPADRSVHGSPLITAARNFCVEVAKAMEQLSPRTGQETKDVAVQTTDTDVIGAPRCQCSCHQEDDDVRYFSSGSWLHVSSLAMQNRLRTILCRLNSISTFENHLFHWATIPLIGGKKIVIVIRTSVLWQTNICVYRRHQFHLNGYSPQQDLWLIVCVHDCLQNTSICWSFCGRICTRLRSFLQLKKTVIASDLNRDVICIRNKNTYNLPTHSWSLALSTYMPIHFIIADVCWGTTWPRPIHIIFGTAKTEKWKHFI